MRAACVIAFNAGRRLMAMSALLGVAVLGRARPAGGQNLLTVTSSSVTLNITTAVAGADPTPKNNTASNYSVRMTGATAKKITAQLSANMPIGVTVTVTFAAPTGATSLGAVALTTTAQSLVTGITNTATQSRAITYELLATPVAGVIASGSRTITFTLVNGP